MNVKDFRAIPVVLPDDNSEESVVRRFVSSMLFCRAAMEKKVGYFAFAFKFGESFFERVFDEFVSRGFDAYVVNQYGHTVEYVRPESYFSRTRQPETLPFYEDGIIDVFFVRTGKPPGELYDASKAKEQNPVDYAVSLAVGAMWYQAQRGRIHALTLLDVERRNLRNFEQRLRGEGYESYDANAFFEDGTLTKSLHRRKLVLSLGATFEDAVRSIYGDGVD